MKSVSNSLSRNKSDYGEYSTDIDTVSNLSESKSISKNESISNDSDFDLLPKLDITEFKESIAKKNIQKNVESEKINKLNNEISSLKQIIDKQNGEINKLKDNLSGGDGEDTNNNLKIANNKIKELENKPLQTGGDPDEENKQLNTLICDIAKLIDIDDINIKETYCGDVDKTFDNCIKILLPRIKQFIENAINEQENNELLILAIISQSMYSQNNQNLQQNYNQLTDITADFDNMQTEIIGGDNNLTEKTLEESKLKNLLAQTVNEIEKGSDIIKNLSSKNDNRYNNLIVSYSEKLVNLEQLKEELTNDLQKYNKDLFIGIGGDGNNDNNSFSNDNRSEFIANNIEKTQLENMLNIMDKEINDTDSVETRKIRKLEKLRNNIKDDLNNI